MNMLKKYALRWKPPSRNCFNSVNPRPLAAKKEMMSMNQTVLLEHSPECEGLEEAVPAATLSDKKIYLAVKRLFDVLISLVLGLVLTLPLLVVGGLVWLDSEGPAIFKQDRMGKDGKVFTIYKFRTMKMSAPKDVAAGALENPDQYITRMGAFLRRTSIDELPQLWNVLRGDMSLVGYRPLCLTEAEVNAKRAKLGVLAVRPGITGLAQVNGRNNITDEEKVRLDVQYVRECSLKMDLICLVKTVTTVLTGEGAE